MFNIDQNRITRVAAGENEHMKWKQAQVITKEIDIQRRVLLWSKTTKGLALLELMEPSNSQQILAPSALTIWIPLPTTRSQELCNKGFSKKESPSP